MDLTMFIEENPFWAAAVVILPLVSIAFLIIFRQQIAELLSTTSRIKVKDIIDIVFSRGDGGAETVVVDDPPAMLINDSNIQDIVNRAKDYCIKGDYNMAASLLKEKDAQAPDNFDILRALVHLYLEPRCRLMRHEDVLKLISDKYNIFCNVPEYHWLLCLVYMEMRDEMVVKRQLGFSTIDVKAKAIEASNKAIGLDVNNPSWYRLLGYVNYWFGDIDQAIQITEGSLKMAESTGASEHEILGSKNNLACYYASTGDRKYEKISREYSEIAYAKDPDNTAVIDTYGYVKWKFAKDRDELKEASDILEMALRKDPYDLDIRRHHIECLQELKSKEEKTN